MGNKIKVLHVIGKRPKGGIGTFLINMNSNIDTSKIQFDYLINASTPEGEFDNKVKRLGSNVFVLPELSYKNTFKYLKELYSFFQKNHDYKVVHVHSVNIGLFNYLMAIKYGIKYRISHSHSIKYSDKFFNSLRNYFLQLPIKKLSNIYFACSKQAAIFLYGEKNVKNNKVSIIKNAIDPQKFQFNSELRAKIRQEMCLEENLVIGHVGAFLPVKNHTFIIDIFYEVYKRNKKALLILIGTGELEDKIREKVNELELEKVVLFLGTRHDVNNLMQAFDIFILPSMFEGFPLVSLEAQAAGLPCIFSDKITEEVKITNLVTFKSIKGNPQEWANAILQFSVNNNRSNTLNFIVDSGYDVKVEAEKLQKFYMDLR